MKKITAVLFCIFVGWSSAFVSCGSTQVRPDKEQIQQRSKKAFQELEREEERQKEE